jgi:murein DD-endopeptidase MepM/ murein hydrolase activator NlpD
VITVVNPLLGNLGMTPVRTGGLTGRVGSFGKTRRNDDGSPKLHKGIDLLCIAGWPVYAAHSGKVTTAGWQNSGDHGEGFGLRVWIASEYEAMKSVYAHLSEITVVTGNLVGFGDLIGYAGRSGNVEDATPTHLHFELHAPRPVDPAPYLAVV